MLKKRFLGAIILPAVLAVPSMYNIICSDGQVMAYADQTTVDLAISKARKAAELAGQNPSEYYPGLAEYIEQLISEIETNDYANMEVAVEALNEATESVPLLLGINAAGEKRVAVQSNKSESKLATQQKADRQAVRVKVEVQPKSEDKQVAEAVEKQEKVAESQSVANEPVELPKTGAPENKLSIAGLIAAGITVVVATALAAGVIIRAKRK